MDSIKELLGSGNVSDVLRMAEDESVGRSIAANVNLARHFGKVR